MKQNLTLAIVLAVSLFFVASCSSQKEFAKIKFKDFDVETQKDYVYRFVIPKNYEENNFKRSLESEEKQFTYADASMIYITNEKGTPIANYNNIDSDSIAIQKSFLALMENDTLTLQGKYKLGKYWKNKKLKEISIGYLNVPENRKADFDKAISSIKMK